MAKTYSELLTYSSESLGQSDILKLPHVIVQTLDSGEGTIAYSQQIHDIDTNKSVADAISDLENSIESSASDITSKINALDLNDSAVAKSFVTSVSETDGLISVTRGAVTSTDKTVTISSGNDGGIDLAANIDGSTIVKDGSGVLSVASSALTQYVGENAIAISDADSSNNKTVSLTIASNDLLLTNGSTGLYATLGMKKVTSGLDENVREAFVLTDKNGNQVGEQINIYKDASLESVSLDGQQLVFVYNLANGTQSTVYVDISNFLAESEFSNGLQVSSHVVSVKVDSSSESYLTVSSSGIKLSGVDSAIETAASKATTVVAKSSSASHLTLTSATSSTTGATTYTIGESDIASATDLSSLATAAGVTVGTDGTISYTSDTSANYINAATSIVDATNKLDTQLKTVADGLENKVIVSADSDNAITEGTDKGAYLSTTFDAGEY